MSEQPQPSPQPQAPTQSQPQPKPVRWVWDLVLALIVLVGLPAIYAGASYFVYRLGLNNEFPLRLEICLVFGAVASCAFVFLGRFLANWRRLTRLGRSLRLLFVIWVSLALVNAVGEVLLIPTVPVLKVWFWPARQVAAEWNFLTGLRQWVLERADFQAIRDWAKANPGWQDEFKEFWEGPVVEHRPECVRPLQAASVRVTDDGASILIGWGGGFHHWGLVIASENEPTPEEPHAEYVFPVAPGVYLWEEAG